MSWEGINESHDTTKVIERPSFPVLPDGKYQFVVSKFQRYTSKKGEPKYLLEAFTEHTFAGDEESKTVTISDYLDPIESSAWYWKTNAFLRSIGGSGVIALEVDPDGTYRQVIGAVFMAETKIQKNKGADGTDYQNARFSKYLPAEV